ncbi:hypothetical protein M5E87_02380 [Flavonifractor plautii]|nr:hypothetical protein M5E87_02380 [Flavonifractor plautii]
MLELLMMNGYRYSDLIGRSGKNLLLRIDGRRNVFYGSPPSPPNSPSTVRKPPLLH